MRFVEFRDVHDLELSYPLFFQENYAKFERTKGWTLSLFSDGKALIPIRIKKNKFIRQAQYLFPPL